jgi:hypothetical protein
LENSSSTKKIAAIFSLIVFGYLLFYLFQFTTGSLFYFGEAVSYEGLIRLLHAKPFASLPAEIPLSLTPYTPLFLSPVLAVGKILKLVEIREVMILARVSQIGILFILFLFINHFRKTFFSDVSHDFAYFAVAALVFFFHPTLELALRPDAISFLAEAVSVFYLFKYLRYSQTKSIILASLASGMAIGLKLNTIGAVLGISLFLFFTRNFKSLSLYLLGCLMSSSLLIGFQYLALGPVFTHNILLSIQSLVLSAPDAIKVYAKLFDLFLLPLGFYLFLVFHGLSLMTQRKERLLLSLVLLCSFVVALLGQLKWGAFHNYFLGCVYLGTLPASLTVYQLSNTKEHTRNLYFVIFFCALLSLFMVRATSILVKIRADRSYFKELSQLKTLVKEKIPNGLLYTTDEQIHLAFVERMAVGVLSEELLQTTPKLSPYLEPLFKTLFSPNQIKGYILPCDKVKTGEIAALFLQKQNIQGFSSVQTGRFCLLF